ncbi:hypothetical protein MRX96_040281 [Rhipicephalus microplus]
MVQWTSSRLCVNTQGLIFRTDSQGPRFSSVSRDEVFSADAACIPEEVCVAEAKYKHLWLEEQPIYSRSSLAPQRSYPHAPRLASVTEHAVEAVRYRHTHRIHENKDGCSKQWKMARLDDMHPVVFSPFPSSSRSRTVVHRPSQAACPFLEELAWVAMIIALPSYKPRRKPSPTRQASTNAGG